VTAPWLTYREDLQVLDCTVRDGGLTCGHHFDDEFVRALYEANVAAGVDWMEIGYKGSKSVFSRDEFGPWKFSDEEDIRRVIPENDTNLKLCVMADAGKTDWQTDIIPADQSILDMIRVAFYAHQLSEAVEMINDAHEKGYTVCANLMAASTNTETEIEQVLEEVAKSPSSYMAVVDSFGSLYGEQIQLMMKQYRAHMDPVNKGIAVHMHNNQQLAFANTIETIIQGAQSVDATIGGLGRGAGNCPMELLLGFLRNPKFHLRPIFEFLEKHVQPMEGRCDWGPSAQYFITGQLNLHPKEAIAARENEAERGKIVEFYDRMIRDM